MSASITTYKVAEGKNTENFEAKDSYLEDQVGQNIKPVIFHKILDCDTDETSHLNMNTADSKQEVIHPVSFRQASDFGNELVHSAKSDNEGNAINVNMMVKPVKFNVISKLNIQIAEELMKIFSMGVKFKFYKSILYVFDKNEIKEVCNFDIKVVKKVIEFDGVYFNFYYEIEGLLNGVKKLNLIRLYPSEFNSLDWFHRMWGIECMLFANNNSISYLKEYISSIAFNIPEEIEYNFIGWTKIDDKPVYLVGNEAIGSNLTHIKGSNSKFLLWDNKVNEKNAYLHTIDMLNVANISVTLPILTYTLLSLMKSILKEAEVEPKFIMWVHGITGSRKTTLAKLFCNIFGKNAEILPATFKDTQASLEVKAFEYKDSVLIVDDYHPSVDAAEKTTMTKIANHLIRMYGDGIGKSRMTRNMNKQTYYYPRGLCLITGEDTIDGHSSNARIIPIEITSSDVNLSKLTYFQNWRINYTTCIHNFITYIATNYETIRNSFKYNFENIRNEILKDFGHGRLAETVAFLLIAFGIFVDYGYSIKAIDRDKALDLKECAYNVFMEIINKHNSQIANNRPEVMYLMAIQELISSNKVKVCDIGKSTGSSNVAIYQDDMYYYLIPKVAYGLVKQFWSDLGKSYPLGDTATIKALDRDGLLLTCMEGDERKRTVRNPQISSLYSGRPRYLTINKKVMHNILSNI